MHDYDDQLLIPFPFIEILKKFGILTWLIEFTQGAQRALMKKISVLLHRPAGKFRGW
jgi:hypothetical protein